mmetsp:Transcript_6848/g.22444  ORF Transcript_6848/g.22444 Transcript_6848/m.22444 type:complete len:85 (-) Transcript_6848:226-480(-)
MEALRRDTRLAELECEIDAAVTKALEAATEADQAAQAARDAKEEFKRADQRMDVLVFKKARMETTVAMRAIAAQERRDLKRRLQ